MLSSLDQLLTNHPELREAATLLRALMEGMRSIEVHLPPDVPGLEAARVRLGAGIPALAGEPLLNGTALLGALRSIAERLRAAGQVGDVVADVVSALVGGSFPVDLESLAESAIAGEWGAITDCGTRLDVDEQMLIALLDYAARPALEAAAVLVRGAIDESGWSRGSCPACGAPPVLAELRSSSTVGGGERERILRCARCATAWPFPRLECPSCGERDHRQLVYLHQDGEAEFARAECCGTCRRYVKSVASLNQFSSVELLETDLATVGMDMMAVERGYRRAGN